MRFVRSDASPFGRLHGPFFWRVFRQSEMTAAVMVVLEESAFGPYRMVKVFERVGSKGGYDGAFP
jgi:hypothetical protein